MSARYPKDYTKTFTRRFGYNGLFTIKNPPFEIRHISKFAHIKYDEKRKGIPYEDCYLFTFGVLPYITGYTYRHVGKLFHVMEEKLPVEYLWGRKKWFSTAYLKTVEHHCKESYKNRHKPIFTPLCRERLKYICGDIDTVHTIEEGRMALKNAREKGNKFERDIANELKEFYPNARRGMQFQNRFAGTTVPDVEGTPYWIECKHRIQPNIRAALEQAISESTFAKDARTPIAITKANRTEPLVTLRWPDFFGMIKELELLRAKAIAFDRVRATEGCLVLSEEGQGGDNPVTPKVQE